MNYFSELLASFSRQAGMNSPEIARYCGLDRVTVYRFIKGKTLPKDRETVLRLSEVLQLTTDERESLMESYECMRLGPRIYWERKYISSFIGSFSGETSAIPMIQYDVEGIEDSSRDSMLISGRASTLKRIQREILEEGNTSKHGIEIIMRPSITPVMDMLLSAGKKNRELQVKHLIPITTNFFPASYETASLDDNSIVPQLSDSIPGLGSPSQLLQSPIDGDINDSPGLLNKEKYPDRGQRWDYELLQSFFKIISLCAEGFEYMPSYFYSRHTRHSTFPSYTNLLITENSVIMFTDDLEESIFFSEREKVDSFRNKFRKIANDKPALSYTFREVTDFMENMNNVILKRDKKNSDVEYYYCSQPCIIPIITDEIMRKHLRMDLVTEMQNDNAHVLHDIYNYVNSIRSRYTDSDYNQICYMPEGGIRYFLKTGRFAEVPTEMYTPLTEAERREMILKLAGQDNFKFRITRNEMSSPEGMLCIEVMEKALFLEFLVPGKGMCFLYINEPGILLAFRRFFSGLSDENLYSEEESKEILRRVAKEEI